MSVAAAAVAAYLTVAHYADPEILICAESETVNCGAVTTSAQSMFLGIPVALLGLLWAVAMVGLCLPAAWRSPSRPVHLARVVGAVGGMGFVLWLLYAELVIVGVVCLWCTVVHVLAFALFAVVVLTAPDVLAEPDRAR